MLKVFINRIVDLVLSFRAPTPAPPSWTDVPGIMLREIQQLEIRGHYLCNPEQWPHEKAATLNALLNSKHLCRNQVREAISIAVINMAKKMCRNVCNPEHCTSPESIAYALAHNALSPRELGNLDWETGETAESFLRGRATENIIEDIFAQLLGHRTASGEQIKLRAVS